jgi:hypothetical protein
VFPLFLQKVLNAIGFGHCLSFRHFSLDFGFLLQQLLNNLLFDFLKICFLFLLL